MAQNADGSEHRPRLGRGLAALLGSAQDYSELAVTPFKARTAPVEFIRPNPRNPRKRLDDAALDELAESIRERGIVQPILVRVIPQIPDQFEIIAGERRWRAAQRAGKHEVPILVIEAGERDALEIAIIENVQRSDLTALEEANGYAQLGAAYGYSHSEIARIVGKSRSHIANTLRLLHLPVHTQELLNAGQISPGHARALLSVSQPDRVADKIVAEHLTVRDVERLSENPRKNPPAKLNVLERDADALALQDRLGLALGARVTIRRTGESGEIRIAFRNFDQLDEFCRRLYHSPNT